MIEDSLSLNSIFDDRTFIFQSRRGYRFSVDALLLSWFLSLENPSRRAVALELGSGSGVVAILLSRRGFSGRIDCVERDPRLFFLLEKNISYNGLAHALFPVHGDLRHLALPSEHYDLVFFNPPYHSMASGRPSSNSERSIARHDLFGTLGDFLACGATALKKRGALCFIHPASRIAYAAAAISDAGLAVSRLAMIRERTNDAPSLCLYRCVRGRVATVNTAISLVAMRTLTGSPSPTARQVLRSSDTALTRARNLKKKSG